MSYSNNPSFPVYRTVSKKLCVDSTNYNMLLVLLLLGWLFEVRFLEDKTWRAMAERLTARKIGEVVFSALLARLRTDGVTLFLSPRIFFSDWYINHG